MRICIIAEGCYPFVPGGVSSWLHDFILSTPQHEYIVWAIGAQEKQRGKYAYTLPENVIRVEDVFLDSVMHMPRERHVKRMRLGETQNEALYQLLSCRAPDWDVLFDLFRGKQSQTIDFLSSREFLLLLQRICEEEHPFFGFSDYFWTIRSMFLPLLYLMGGSLPEADLYHAVSAGYAGVLGAMAAQTYRKPYMLTEHGIYTREREEEIIRTDWVPQQFKDLWINMFYMFTRCAYQAADCVTSLFQRASHIQQEIGVDPEKCRVISNGIKVEKFEGIPPKPPDGWVDIGAVVRVVPIKDIKTMIYAFANVEAENQKVRLHIIGPTDEDEDYYLECKQLLEELGLKNAWFTGRVNIVEYLEKIDFTLLTSISEGQPLSTLEGMGAGRPAVTTDVGCCRELIEGVGDGYGEAGICVQVMHQAALAEAMLTLSEDNQLRRQMGENGQRRVLTLFSHKQMLEKYMAAYAFASERAEEKWKERVWQE